MTTVFVSHASEDKALVTPFVDHIVDLGCCVPADDVFYSSRRGSGVPLGEDLHTYVRKQATGAKLVIAIITPTFQRRPYCWTELGVAWAKTGNLFPLALPGMDHDKLQGVLTGLIVGSLDDPEALNELHARIADLLGTGKGNHSWEEHRDHWLTELPALVSALPSAQATAAPPSEAAAQPSAAGSSAANLRYGWGHLFDSFVDAALYTRDDRIARDKIEQCINLGTLIPSRYLYSSDRGAANWLALCEERSYTHYQETKRFWLGPRGDRVAAFIDQAIPGNALDYVSLGPGDGAKDAALVNSWLSDGRDIMYYPYDVSLPLISRAARDVYEKGQENQDGVLHIKAVLADIEQLRQMRQVFAHRPVPNVIGLLGNSLGNWASEGPFLSRLRLAMYADDLLMLEVRLKTRGAKAPEVESIGAQRFDFGPLEYYLGAKFEDAKIVSEVCHDLSDVESTETTVIRCAEGSYDGRMLSGVRLVYIHQYQVDAFVKFVTGEGFEVLLQEVGGDGTFLLCVLRLRRSEPGATV